MDLQEIEKKIQEIGWKTKIEWGSFLYCFPFENNDWYCVSICLDAPKVAIFRRFNPIEKIRWDCTIIEGDASSVEKIVELAKKGAQQLFDEHESFNQECEKCLKAAFPLMSEEEDKRHKELFRQELVFRKK